mmetsp:Transcript_61330/g.168339  ORF Transcript_61330/g.168339 Transcript_61330/m.168339 type:complete len:229 (-) Transcript_61330:2243-2929(-)
MASISSLSLSYRSISIASLNSYWFSSSWVTLTWLSSFRCTMFKCLPLVSSCSFCRSENRACSAATRLSFSSFTRLISISQSRSLRWSAKSLSDFISSTFLLMSSTSRRRSSSSSSETCTTSRLKSERLSPVCMPNCSARMPSPSPSAAAPSPPSSAAPSPCAVMAPPLAGTGSVAEMRRTKIEPSALAEKTYESSGAMQRASTAPLCTGYSTCGGTLPAVSSSVSGHA